MLHELVKVTTEPDWLAYHTIRREVLWEARGRIGTYNDKYPDEYHPNHHPLLLKYNNRPIGTVRLDDRKDATAVVRLVAIVADLQGKGHGRVLARSAEDYAWNFGARTLLVNAARTATGYYEKTGWEYFEWDAKELTGIASDCVQMRKALK